MKIKICVFIFLLLLIDKCFSVDYLSLIYPFDWNLNSEEINKYIKRFNEDDLIVDRELRIPMSAMSRESFDSNNGYSITFVDSSDSLILNDHYVLDLELYFPIFIISPINQEFHKEISLLRNKKIIFHKTEGEIVYSPYNLSVLYSEDSSDYLLALDIPRMDAFVSSLYLSDSSKDKYFQGEELGKMKYSDLYIDIIPYKDSRVLYPIIVNIIED